MAYFIYFDHRADLLNSFYLITGNTWLTAHEHISQRIDILFGKGSF